MFRRFFPSFKRLSTILATSDESNRGFIPQILPPLFGLLAATVHSSAAIADSDPLHIEEPQFQVSLGPVVGAVHQTSWDSVIGGELRIHHWRPETRLRHHSLGIGVMTFGSYNAKPRLSLDLTTAVGFGGDLLIGVGMGPLIDVPRVGRAIGGIRGTLWMYGGVTPYVTYTRLLGDTRAHSTEIEFGVRIPFSIRSW